MNSILLAGNWKMNGDSSLANQLIDSVLFAQEKMPAIDWLIFPPSVYLACCRQRLSKSNVTWGAQDVSAFTGGAYTGQISADMLVDMGCTWVLIGHSERRHGLGEVNDVVAEKFLRSLEKGLKPILCVGETASDKALGQGESVVLEQLSAIVPALCKHQPSQLIVAYEPVWAIGTGNHASVAEVRQMHESIRTFLNAQLLKFGVDIRILYGGSVKPNNAAGLIALNVVDGFLIGGASLNNQFIEIGEVCSSLS